MFSLNLYTLSGRCSLTLSFPLFGLSWGFEMNEKGEQPSQRNSENGSERLLGASEKAWG